MALWGNEPCQRLQISQFHETGSLKGLNLSGPLTLQSPWCTLQSPIILNLTHPFYPPLKLSMSGCWTFHLTIPLNHHGMHRFHSSCAIRRHFVPRHYVPGHILSRDNMSLVGRMAGWDGGILPGATYCPGLEGTFCPGVLQGLLWQRLQTFGNIWQL